MRHVSINKRILSIVIVVSLLMSQQLCYAKKINTNERQEFDRPTAEDSKINISENTIIDKKGYKEYNPLNPNPVSINVEEKNSVDNYNIDLKTLETRIKYFSPSYQSVRKNIESMLWMSYYSRGGNVANKSNFKELMKEDNQDIIDQGDAAKELAKEKQKELTAYLKTSNPDPTVVANYKLAIATANAGYIAAKNGIELYIRGLGKQLSMMGLGNALYKASTPDDNVNAKVARQTVTKALSSLVLTCMQLESYMKVLEEQVELNKRIYETYLNSYELGAMTSLDVSTQLKNYESTKNSYESLKTTYTNVKEQVCINLGYNLNDIDKLNFIEPDVDFDYINNINIDDDREKAYNSNSSYKNIKISDKDRKFPGSTGEDIYNKRRKYMSEKVVVALEDVYSKLMAAKLSYEGAEFLKEEIELDKEACERKKNNNLVSEAEYMGLKVQILANELQVLQAKYDLINASNDYYYAVTGQMSVS